MNVNEVEPRLGTYIAIHARSITLTYSQKYLQSTCRNPHPYRAQPPLSQ
jgi:hypothetical protein